MLNTWEIGSISDDEVDGDNEPLPDFLLPEYSQKDKVYPVVHLSKLIILFRLRNRH